MAEIINGKLVTAEVRKNTAEEIILKELKD